MLVYCLIIISVIISRVHTAVVMRYIAIITCPIVNDRDLADITGYAANMCMWCVCVYDIIHRRCSLITKHDHATVIWVCVPKCIFNSQLWNTITHMHAFTHRSQDLAFKCLWLPSVVNSPCQFHIRWAFFISCTCSVMEILIKWDCYPCMCVHVWDSVYQLKLLWKLKWIYTESKKITTLDAPDCWYVSNNYQTIAYAISGPYAVCTFLVKKESMFTWCWLSKGILYYWLS